MYIIKSNSISFIISEIKFRVDPYETTVIYLPGFTISILPIWVLILGRLFGSFSLILYAFKHSMINAGWSDSNRVL